MASLPRPAPSLTRLSPPLGSRFAGCRIVPHSRRVCLTLPPRAFNVSGALPATWMLMAAFTSRSMDSPPSHVPAQLLHHRQHLRLQFRGHILPFQKTMNANRRPQIRQPIRHQQIETGRRRRQDTEHLRRQATHRLRPRLALQIRSGAPRIPRHPRTHRQHHCLQRPSGVHRPPTEIVHHIQLERDPRPPGVKPLRIRSTRHLRRTHADGIMQQDLIERPRPRRNRHPPTSPHGPIPNLNNIHTLTFIDDNGISVIADAREAATPCPKSCGTASRTRPHHQSWKLNQI